MYFNLLMDTTFLKPGTCFIHSVQFSHSVMTDSLRPHGLQHARLPCPSPTPRACSNSCPLSSIKTSKDSVLCIPWAEPRPCLKATLLSLGCSSQDCIPSLLWLATVGICPWELREGHGGWSLFPTSKGGQGKASMPRSSHRVLFGFRRQRLQNKQSLFNL